MRSSAPKRCNTFTSIASRATFRDDREAPLLVARDGRQRITVFW
jgi:hypothetical protein